MSKTALYLIIAALTTYSVTTTVIAVTYEYYNDRLILALGECIGVNKMRKK